MSEKRVEIPIGGSGKVKVVVQRGEYRGVDRVDVRQFVDLEKDGNFIPTKKGISIPVDDLGLYIQAIMEVGGLK